MTEDQKNDPCLNDVAIRELVAKALLEIQDDDSDWGSVITLRRCSTQEVFDIAVSLCKSAVATERSLCATVLGQFGEVIDDPETGGSKLDRVFQDEISELLLSMLAQEKVPDVLNHIGVAFGHIQEPRAVEPLSRLKNHPESEVRFGVAFGLLCQESELAIQTLIELSQDSDDDVRDWTTFGLGSQIEHIDTPELREALFRNIDDSDEDTRYEALMGLVHRKDERVIAHVIEEMASGEYDLDSYEFPRFCRMLTALKNRITDSRLPDLLKQCEELDEE